MLLRSVSRIAPSGEMITVANFNLDQYVTVAERISKFREQFPTGAIITQVLEATDDRVLVRAEVFRDINDQRPASSGTAEERRNDGYVNKTSAVENCESSAAGRALALLGYSVDRGIASREEIAGAKDASAELERQDRIKQQLRAATEEWVAAGELVFESGSDAAAAYMSQELLLHIEGTPTPEEWDQLEKELSQVSA